eukprot:scaffold14294_cov31-Tisochrysis_lutea.AAC.2
MHKRNVVIRSGSESMTKPQWSRMHAGSVPAKGYERPQQRMHPPSIDMHHWSIGLPDYVKNSAPPHQVEDRMGERRALLA